MLADYNFEPIQPVVGYLSENGLFVVVWGGSTAPHNYKSLFGKVVGAGAMNTSKRR